MLLLIASLTALQACGIVFVVDGAQNNARSVLSDTAAIGGSFDVACGCRVDGVK